ncbi:hypothetical protein FA15DRAFT_748415, partial [Coprinopsis marcescibilis]
QFFVWGHRISLTGMLTLDGIAARTAGKGSMTKEMYLNFLENSVVYTTASLFFALLLTAYPCSFQSAHHIQDHRMFSSWIMLGSTMVMRFLHLFQHFSDHD